MNAEALSTIVKWKFEIVFTFMISNDVENWRVGENLLQQIVNSIHDLSVAAFCCFPNSVINDVACVINSIDNRMSGANSTQCVFDSLPGRVAVLQREFVELRNFSFNNCLLYNLPIGQQRQRASLPCRRFFGSKLGSGKGRCLPPCNVDRNEDQSNE